MRYKKQVNGVTTEYYYDGSQLVMENRNGKRIWYIYGVTGIEGMIYEEQLYYLDKNTLGDVIAIRDSIGNINAKGLANAILRNTSATVTGMISGMRSLTGNTAFSNVVSQEFILATGRINIMTVINSAVMSFRNFYLVD